MIIIYIIIIIIQQFRLELEMHSKAQHDSPILVLLAPPGDYDYDWMIRRAVPSENSNSNRENGSNNYPVKIQQQHKKPHKVAISNSFYTIVLQCFDTIGWVVGRASSLPKTEWWGAGMVICLGRGADLHMAQLIPLPLTISCSSKSRLVLPFW